MLAGGAPPPVGANIRQFLTVMQARKRLTGYFGLAVTPDSNLNAASESEIIYIDTVFGRLPFTREGDFGAESGFGLPVWGGGEVQHRDPRRERLWLRIGAGAVVREYPVGDFDQHFLAALAGRPDYRNQPAGHGTALMAGQPTPCADEFGVRIELDRRLTSRLWARGTASVRKRDHQHDFLDGLLTDFTFTLAWAPVLRVHMTVGYTRDQAALEHWRSLSRWVWVDTSLALPLGFTLGTSIQAQRVYCDGAWRPHLTLRGRDAPASVVQRLGAQPRLHRVRIQPATGVHSRRAPDQRAGV